MPICRPNHFVTRLSCGAALSLAAAACAAKSSSARDSTTRPAQAADSASHAASAALAVHPSAPENDSASGDFGRGARDSTAARRTGPDSAIRIQIATQPKSRTKADSISLVAAIRTGLSTSGWPVKTPALLAGSILPAKRIVAFYGNPLSKRMGILGEIPYDQMLTKLDSV